MGSPIPQGERQVDAPAARALIEPLTALIAKACGAVAAINRRAMNVADKADGSPVSEADLIADRIIAEGLAQIAPDIPALSEERCQSVAIPAGSSFFLIDPLDGTREFIAGRGEFTINLALITHDEPLLGIIGAPALGMIWRAIVGERAERLPIGADGLPQAAQPIRTRPHPAPGQPWVAGVSRSHGDPRTEAFIAARPGAIRERLGSAIKLCRVAEGTIDVYPRLSPTSEWDIAAGHAIVTAAGGHITDSSGAPLRFGTTPGHYLVPDFIAWGDPAAATGWKHP